MEDLNHALEMFSAILDENPILGTGGTAIVYHVIVNGRHFALKIVPQQFRYILEREVSWLHWQNFVTEVENISQLEASVYLPSGSLAVLLYPVGSSIKDISREYIPEICRVLSGLHREKYRHGDAKIPNFVITDDERIVVIDFGFTKHFKADDLPIHAEFDMYRIAASFLGLDNSSNLDLDPNKLIAHQTDHIDIIRDALQSYVDSGYAEEAAIEFGQRLSQL